MDEIQNDFAKMSFMSKRVQLHWCSALCI